MLVATRNVPSSLTHARTHTHAHTRTRKHTRTHMRMHTCTRTHTHTHTHTRMHAHTHAHGHTHAHAHTHTHTHTQSHINLCIPSHNLNLRLYQWAQKLLPSEMKGFVVWRTHVLGCLGKYFVNSVNSFLDAFLANPFQADLVLQKSKKKISFCCEFAQRQ